MRCQNCRSDFQNRWMSMSSVILFGVSSIRSCRSFSLCFDLAFWFPDQKRKHLTRNRGSSAASRGAVWGAAWGGSLLVCLIWLNDMKSILIFTSPVVVLTYFDTFKHFFCCFPFNVKKVRHYATVHFLTICSDQTGGSWLEDHPARVPAVPVVAVASNRSSKGTKRCQLEDWSKPDWVCIDVFLVYFRYFMSFSYFGVSSWCS